MTNLLNFHHLRYFWLVAKTGNLTEAARSLRVSQSSVSAQIAQLEAALGQPLFQRHHRRLELTPFGALVLHYAEEIFELGGELLHAVQGGPEDSVRLLRLGSVATLSRNFQEGLLKPFIGRHHLRLILESGSLEELLERVKTYKLDVVLSNRSVVSRPGLGWRCLRIARQTISLVGPPRRSRKPFQFPADARDLRLLLPGPSSDVRTQIDALWDSLGLTPHIAAEVDDMALLRLLARDGAGVAAVPAVVVRDELRERKLAVYCTLPEIHENFYAITLRRQRRSSLVSDLLRDAQRTVQATL